MAAIGGVFVPSQELGIQYELLTMSLLESRFEITNEIYKARNVIVSSQGRKRTLEEIIVLDTLNRPPDDWKRNSSREL